MSTFTILIPLILLSSLSFLDFIIHFAIFPLFNYDAGHCWHVLHVNYLI